MAKLMKMEKDGIVREVVPSAFYRVWVLQGWSPAAEDAPVDPHILGLEPDQTLEDYKQARDAAREEAANAEARRQEALNQLAAQRSGLATPPEAPQGVEGAVQGQAPAPNTQTGPNVTQKAGGGGGDVQASGDSAQKAS